MRLYGLMITKDDQAVFADWCRHQLPLYDAVVCLDGSTSDHTAEIARAHSERIIYLDERDFRIPYKTDHGLRAIAHRELIRHFGTGSWIMCCHPDEFCYHDPRRIADIAERGDHDLVSWFTLQFYPHSNERVGWSERQDLPIYERFRYYHWSFRGSGLPWLEDRLYRARSGVEWDGVTHGSVRPHGIARPAPFHPILQHYKVCSVQQDQFEVIGASSYYRNHWTDQVHRTGVAFEVHRTEDLFVSHVKNYACCSRFDGTFEHPWNLGDEFRFEHVLAGKR
jgi:hypothetical protein